MAKENSLTPEKQLLRLIEENKDFPSVNKVDKDRRVRRIREWFSFSAWKGKIIFLKENFFKRKQTTFAYTFGFKYLNRFLSALVLILILYLIHDVTLALNSQKSIPNLNYNLPQLGKTVDFTQEGILKKSSSYYLDKVSQKDIFNMEEKKAKVSSAKDNNSEAVQEMAKHLRLVGISWSENPDAMIEDSRAMRTFFVKRGQMLGEFKVKAIYKDRVILEYNNQDIELK